jgi:hypothetical protein
MTKKYYQGRFNPKNKSKYKGDLNAIFYRSSWEAYFMNWLDKKDFVLEWKSEETIIPYISPIDNKQHRYFVDFWAKFKTKEGTQEFLIEIKPKKESLPPKQPKKQTKQYVQKVVTYLTNQAKWEAAEAFAHEHNMFFKVLTESELFNK